MEERRRRSAFQSLYSCLLLAGLLAPGVCQLQVLSTETNQPFSNPENITVGLASDLVVQVRCISLENSPNGSGRVQWNYAVNGSEVDMGLKPFGTSQEGGVLRVYPANVLVGEGAVFQCSDGNMTMNVAFDLRDSLFFLRSLPATISVFQDPLDLCQSEVPDIPAAQVSVINANNLMTGREYFYCHVETARGTFRSRSIILLPAPSFVYEPENIMARPVNGTATAAFSCAVVPAAGLVQIQWYYEMMSFVSGSRSGMGMGPRPGLSSGEITNDVEGVTIVEMADSGTSILVLNSVGNGDEGLFSCVAIFANETRLNSFQAALTYNRTSLGDSDVIILAPPINISVIEEDAVSLPCVGSRGTAPTFSLDGVVQTSSSQYSLDLNSITTSNAGTYTCQVGGTTATVTIEVADRPTMTDIIQVGAPTYTPELISDADRIVLRCLRFNSRRWLQNGVVVVDVNPSLSLSPADTGRIYQCVGVTLGQPETDYTGELGSDFYLLVPAVRSPIVAPRISTFIFGQTEVATLNCSVSGNPLPLLQWSRDGIPVDGAQAATGFMERASSILTVNLTELGLGTYNFQCSATVDTPVTEPIVMNAMGGATITVEALLRNISVVPEMQALVLDNNPNTTVVLNCSVVADPPPMFKWMVNGAAFSAEPVVRTGDLEFSSSLVLTLGQLNPGVNSAVCSVENSNNSLIENDPATITIYTPPIFTVDPQNMTVSAGYLVSLTCSAQATPIPDITWVATDTNSTIMDDSIFNITFSVSGDVQTSVLTFTPSMAMVGPNRFHCVANNTVRVVEGETAVLIVNTPPTFIVDPQSVTVIIGDFVSINCSAQVTPLPDITWTYRRGISGANMDVMDDAMFNISSSSDGDVTTSILTFISNSAVAGINTFFCLANNSVNTVQSNTSTVTVQIYVTIYENPMDVSVVAPNGVTLRCKASGQPTPEIVWIKNEFTLTANNVIIDETIDGTNKTSKLTIGPSSPQDTGTYTCRAQNTLSVMTSSEAQVNVFTFAPLNVQASQASNSAAVEVSWSHPSGEVARSTINGYRIFYGNGRNIYVPSVVTYIGLLLNGNYIGESVSVRSEVGQYSLFSELYTVTVVMGNEEESLTACSREVGIAVGGIILMEFVIVVVIIVTVTVVLCWRRKQLSGKLKSDLVMETNMAYGELDLCHSELVGGGVYEDFDKMVTLVRPGQENYELRKHPSADEVPAAGSQQTTPMLAYVGEKPSANSKQQQRHSPAAVAQRAREEPM